MIDTQAKVRANGDVLAKSARMVSHLLALRPLGSIREGFLRGLLFVVVAMYPLSLLAGPTVQNVAGPLRDGETLVVQGTGFGVKNHAAPIYWADFESGIDPSPLGRRTTWDEFSSSLARTDVLAAPGSQYAVRGDLGLDIGNYPVIVLGLKQYEADKMYIFVKRYYATDLSLFYNNLKTLRFWHNLDAGPLIHDWYTAYVTGSPIAFCELTETYAHWLTRPIVAGNTWITQEYEYKTGDIDQANGIVHQYENGVNVSSSADIRDDNFVMRTSAYPDKYNDWFIQDDVSNYHTTQPGNFVYYDDVYMDDSWARVMIGNKPTWTESTQREIQIPSAWSDNSISVTLNQGGFPSFNSAYLYVIDPDGNVNQTGFPLCAKCPGAPALTVK